MFMSRIIFSCYYNGCVCSPGILLHCCSSAVLMHSTTPSPLLVRTLLQKKRLSIVTSFSDRSDADSVEGSPLHHGGSAPTPPPLSSATPPSTVCCTGSLHDSSERDRSSTPLSNGSAEERVIVVKVCFQPQLYDLLLVTMSWWCHVPVCKRCMLACLLINSQIVAT